MHILLLGVMTSVLEKPAVHCSSNSKILVLNQQNICDSGPPMTLSAVGRIRSGSNGLWWTCHGHNCWYVNWSLLLTPFHFCLGQKMRRGRGEFSSSDVFSLSNKFLQQSIWECEGRIFIIRCVFSFE